MSNPDFDRNILGPYRILSRFKGLGVGLGVGKLYSAVRQLTGRRALVVVPSSQDHWHPAEEFRLHIRTGRAPAFIALEVEQAPRGTAALTQMVDGLDVLANALEDLAKRHDARVYLTAARARPRWLKRAGLSALGAAAAGLALLLLHQVDGKPPAVFPAAADGYSGALAQAGLAEEVLLPAEPFVPLLIAEASLFIGYPMPSKPFPGQAGPDKDGKCEHSEKLINGACWTELKEGPPCKKSYEWKGSCFKASFDPKPEPRSGASGEELPGRSALAR